MALSLKVNVVGLSQIKTMRFLKEMTVYEACIQVQEKMNHGGKDFGFFKPAGKDGNTGRWLKSNKPLSFYELPQDSLVEYRSRYRQLKIELLDKTVKTVLVDDSHTVEEIVTTIAKKMHINNEEEFSLQLRNPRYDPTNLQSKERQYLWLHPNLSLHEQNIPESAELVLKKKYHFTDGTIDRSDPVQLHLIYVECRTNIIDGVYPTTEKEVIELAALHAQILNGDYNPQLHKPNFLGPKDYLPQAHLNKDLIGEIISEWRKLVGMTDMNAKFRYVQTCRSLPTYGITVWPVKIKRGFVYSNDKKEQKLESFLLGITREQLLIMDAATKEVLKKISLMHIKRWAASSDMFTLDLGDYEKDYLNCETAEGEEIKDLVAGYLDLILKARKEAKAFIDDDDLEFGGLEDIGNQYGFAMTGNRGQTGRGQMTGTGREGILQPQGLPGRGSGLSGSHTIEITDPESAIRAAMLLIEELSNPDPKRFLAGNSTLTPQQYHDQMLAKYNALATATKDYLGGKGGRQGLNVAVKNMMNNILDLSDLAQQALGSGDDMDFSLLDASRRVSEALVDLLRASNEDKEEADRRLQMAMAALASAIKGNLVDDATQQFIQEAAKNAAAAADDLKRLAEKHQLDGGDLARGGRNLVQTANILGMAMVDPQARAYLDNSAMALENFMRGLMAAASDLGLSEEDMASLLAGAKSVSDALKMLLLGKEIGEQRGSDLDTASFQQAAAGLKYAFQTLRESMGNAAAMSKGAQLVTAAVIKAVHAAKVAAANADDKESVELLERVRETNVSLEQLLKAVTASAQDLSDQGKRQTADKATDELEKLANNLLLSSSKLVLASGLRRAAKKLAATTTGLAAEARVAASALEKREDIDFNVQRALAEVSDLLQSVKHANEDLSAMDAQLDLLEAAYDTAYPSQKLIASARRNASKLQDPNRRQRLLFVAGVAEDSVQALFGAIRAYSDCHETYPALSEAIELVGGVLTEIDNAEEQSKAGKLSAAAGTKRDAATELLAMSTRSLKAAVAQMKKSAKKADVGASGEAAASVASELLTAVMAAKTVAETIGYRDGQKKLLAATHKLAEDAQVYLRQARSVLANASKNNRAELKKAQRTLDADLASILTSFSTVDTSQLDRALQSVADATAQIGQASGGSSGGSNQQQLDSLEAAAALTNTARAFGAALTQVSNAALNNPKTLQAAVKMAASAYQSLVRSGNDAIGANSSPAAKSAIEEALKNVAKTTEVLLEFAKAKAIAPADSSNDKRLAAAEQAAQTAVSALVKASGGGTNEDIERSAKLLERALKLLSKPDQTASADPLAELSHAARALGVASAEVIGASTTQPANLGVHTKNAATQVLAAVVAANSLKTGGGSVSGGAPKKLTSVVAEIREASGRILDAVEDSDNTQLVEQARVLASKTKELTDHARQIAAQLPKDEEETLLQAVAEVKRAVAPVASAAKHAASAGDKARENMEQALDGFNTQLRQMLAAASKSTAASDAGEGQSSSAAGSSLKPEAIERVHQAVGEVARSTQSLVTAAGNVASKPRDRQTQSSLTAAASALSDALRALTASITAVTPGIAELESALQSARQSVGSLTQAQVSAASGSLKSSSSNAAQAGEKLITEVALLAKTVRRVPAAARDGTAMLGSAAEELAESLSRVAASAIEAAAASKEQQRQEQVLSMVKTLADETNALLKASHELAKNATSDNTQEVKSLSDAIAARASVLTGALQSNVALFKEFDDIISNLQSQSKQVGADKASSSAAGAAFLDSKEELSVELTQFTAATRELLGLDRTKTVEVIAASKKAAERVSVIVELANAAASAAEEASVRKGIEQSTARLVAGASQLVKQARAAAEDPDNDKAKDGFVQAFNEAGASAAALTAAVRVGAVGDLECEKALDSLGKLATELDAASLFAAAGQLAAGTKSELKSATAALQTSAKGLQTSADQASAAAGQSQEQLGSAVRKLAAQFEQTGRDARELASLLKDSTRQQELLVCAKQAADATAKLVVSAKAHNRRRGADTADSLNDAAKNVAAAIGKLLEVAASAAAESSRAAKELAKDAAAVMSLLDQYESLRAVSGVDPVEVVFALRSLLNINAKLLSAYGTKDQNQVIEASRSVRDATQTLAQQTKNASALCTAAGGDKTRQALQQALGGVAGATSQMLSVAGAAMETKEDRSVQLSRAIEDVCSSMAPLVSALNRVPGGEGLKLEEDSAQDLEAVAEQELLAAARAIEAAARSLVRGKELENEYTVGEQDVSGKIMNEAREITTATAKLIRAAALAQADRRQTTSGPRYNADPAWANGLISAAKEVAGTTQALVLAANRAMSDEGEDEIELIATARAVAASTAQLTTASKVKADNPNAKSQVLLTEAAGLVASSTTRLVTITKEDTARREAEALAKAGGPRFKTGRIVEMEEKTHILKLEAELDQARKELARRRRARYQQ